MSENGRFRVLGRFTQRAALTAAMGLLAFNEGRDLLDASARATLTARHIEAGRAAVAGGRPRLGVAAAERALRLDLSSREAGALWCDAWAAQIMASPDDVPTNAVAGLMHDLALCLESGAQVAEGLHVALGVLAGATGDSAAAKESFDRAVAANPDFGPAHYFLGNQWLRAGDHAQAEAAFQRAIERLPKDRRPRLALGLAQKLQQKWAQAVETLTRVVEVGAETIGLAALGEARLKTGQFESAAEELERAIAMAPPESDVSQVHENLGIALFQLRRYADAISHLQVALARKKSSATAYNLGVAHAATGDLRRAAALFEQIIDAEPTLGEPHGSLVDTLLRLGDLRAARLAAERLALLARQAPSLASVAERAAQAVATAESEVPITHSQRPNARKP